MRFGFNVSGEGARREKVWKNLGVNQFSDSKPDTKNLGSLYSEHTDLLLRFQVCGLHFSMDFCVAVFELS